MDDFSFVCVCGFEHACENDCTGNGIDFDQRQMIFFLVTIFIDLNEMKREKIDTKICPDSHKHAHTHTAHETLLQCGIPNTHTHTQKH